jgi:hypothetical protein
MLPEPSREPWQSLMQALITGELDGPQFERAFLDAWRDARDNGERVPYAADLMFYEVDAYCADPALRGPEDLDEVGLRAAALSLVGRLDEPWPKLPGAPSDEQQMKNFERAVAALGRKGK